MDMDIYFDSQVGIRTKSQFSFFDGWVFFI